MTLLRPYYTKRFALWPRRVDSGAWVFFSHYWITPDSNGQGRILSHSEYLEEHGRVEL